MEELRDLKSYSKKTFTLKNKEIPDAFIQQMMQNMEHQKYMVDLNRKAGKNPKGGTSWMMTEAKRIELRKKRKRKNKVKKLTHR